MESYKPGGDPHREVGSVEATLVRSVLAGDRAILGGGSYVRKRKCYVQRLAYGFLKNINYYSDSRMPPSFWR